MRLRRFIEQAVAALIVDAVLADVPFSTDAAAYNGGALGNSPNQTFRSSPIIAPILQVTKFDQTSVDKTYLLVDWSFDGVSSPMIFRSDDLSLVYAGQQYHTVIGTRVQIFDGEAHLTFWEGERGVPYDLGRCRAFDSQYRPKYSITPVGALSGRLADQHECHFTEEGTALISVYEAIPYDLTPVGGARNGTVLDSLFQEIDPRTGELVFQWRASEHYGIEDSVFLLMPEPDVLDFYHLNSVEKYDGNYLVNGRATSDVILVNGTDGSTIWTLGGKHNGFEDISGGAAVGFQAQHHASFEESRDDVTLFDNNAFVDTVGCTANCSSGVHVRLDYDAMTAELVAEYYHPASLSSAVMGGHVTLGSGHALLGWGSQPAVTEHDGDKAVMDIQTGRVVNGVPPSRQGPQGRTSVYRAYKMDWKASPSWDPSIAVENGVAYVSWNGATEVATWVVHGSDKLETLDKRESVIGRSKRRGFETAIQLEGEKAPMYMRALALDSGGSVIGRTKVREG